MFHKSFGAVPSPRSVIQFPVVPPMFSYTVKLTVESQKSHPLPVTLYPSYSARKSASAVTNTMDKKAMTKIDRKNNVLILLMICTSVKFFFTVGLNWIIIALLALIIASLLPLDNLQNLKGM